MVYSQKERYAFAAQEDRSAPRSRISIPGNLRPAGGKTYQTVVRDLSIAGFSATALTRIIPGTICWLTLPGREALRAKAVWWDNSRVGCAFEQLLSPEELDRILADWPQNESGA